MKVAREGEIEFFVPDESLRRKSETFYNPDMEHQRDVTIAALNVYAKNKTLNVLDPLAASGVRGIRILKEVDNVEKVVFNDANPKAVELIKKNLKLNKVKSEFYNVFNKDANHIFFEMKHRFDYVDIDPFGSPILFLKTVGFALKPRSFLGVTATDTGALSGSFPKTCKRRYGIDIVKMDCYKEIGIRVLITTIMQNLSSFGFAFTPVYSHSNHYFRVLGIVERKNSIIDSNLSKISMISYCDACGNKKVGIYDRCDACGNKMKNLGPLWTGKVKDNEFCKKMLSTFKFKNKKELETCLKEIDEPFYYDVHKISKYLRMNAPKIENVIEKLKDHGFESSRTHIFSRGIKTNAPMKELIKIIKEM